MAIRNLSLNSILDDGFLKTLAKSADLYKIGSNTILDPEEIRIGLKVVPRAVMSLLISELVPMELNGSKDIELPFGKEAFIRVNKNAADDFTGTIYSDNKIVYSFRNRSIPGLGIILLSTFELYDMEDLKKPSEHSEDIDSKIQKLIDQRMELHSLVGRVVEEKISQREALHKLMMVKLNEAVASIGTKDVPIATKGVPIAPPVVAIQKPIEIKPEDITKKEPFSKKGSPLKAFLERKKAPKSYAVEMVKSESIRCPDCDQVVFGSGGYAGCICMGSDQHKKIWIKKTEDGVQLKFSRGWDPENIQLLLGTLRAKK